MQRTLLAGKIHRATVTQADLHYVGSITIDAELMESAGIVEGEQVHVVDITTGARLVTYAITGAAGSGVIGINGAAAHLISPGNLVIIMSFLHLDESERRRAPAQRRARRRGQSDRGAGFRSRRSQYRAPSTRWRVRDVRTRTTAITAVLDFVGVGFGPSNLGLAVAVQEHNEDPAVTSKVTAEFVEAEAGVRLAHRDVDPRCHHADLVPEGSGHSAQSAERLHLPELSDGAWPAHRVHQLQDLLPDPTGVPRLSELGGRKGCTPPCATARG